MVKERREGTEEIMMVMMIMVVLMTQVTQMLPVALAELRRGGDGSRQVADVVGIEKGTAAVVVVTADAEGFNLRKEEIVDDLFLLDADDFDAVKVDSEDSFCSKLPATQVVGE